MHKCLGLDVLPDRTVPKIPLRKEKLIKPKSDRTS